MIQQVCVCVVDSMRGDREDLEEIYRTFEETSAVYAPWLSFTERDLLAFCAEPGIELLLG